MFSFVVLSFYLFEKRIEFKDLENGKDHGDDSSLLPIDKFIHKAEGSLKEQF